MAAGSLSNVQKCAMRVILPLSPGRGRNKYRFLNIHDRLIIAIFDFQLLLTLHDIRIGTNPFDVSLTHESWCIGCNFADIAYFC